MVNVKRKQRIRWEYIGHLRFLTFSCYQGLHLFDVASRCQIFVDSLGKTRCATEFKLVGWVIMPNHVHLMILPKLPEYPVAKVLHRLKWNVSRRILNTIKSQESKERELLTDPQGRLHFWQDGGGYDRNIVSQKVYEDTMDYIHFNPVKAELVQSPIDWIWSSARWYENKKSVIEIDRI